jgi:peroxiredoxin
VSDTVLSSPRRRSASALRWPALALFLLVAASSGAASEPEIRPWSDLEDPIAPHLTPGAWTLVMFWSVTCEICAVETPVLNAFYEQERDRGVHILGVSIDGPGMRTEAARWMKHHQMRFPSLIGELSWIAAYFAAATEEPFLGTPTFMIFDPRGRLVGVNAGPVRIQAVKDFIARKQRAE